MGEREFGTMTISRSFTPLMIPRHKMAMERP
jgi:hypothetical protein